MTRLAAAILILSLGCAHHAPCMTGFDLGTSIGRTDPIGGRNKATYAEMSATVYFDTTGACRDDRQPF